MSRPPPSAMARQALGLASSGSDSSSGASDDDYNAAPSTATAKTLSATSSRGARAAPGSASAYSARAAAAAAAEAALARERLLNPLFDREGPVLTAIPPDFPAEHLLLAAPPARTLPEDVATRSGLQHRVLPTTAGAHAVAWRAAAAFQAAGDAVARRDLAHARALSAAVLGAFERQERLAVGRVALHLVSEEAAGARAGAAAGALAAAAEAAEATTAATIRAAAAAAAVSATARTRTAMTDDGGAHGANDNTDNGVTISNMNNDMNNDASGDDDDRVAVSRQLNHLFASSNASSEKIAKTAASLHEYLRTRHTRGVMGPASEYCGLALITQALQSIWNSNQNQQLVTTPAVTALHSASADDHKPALNASVSGSDYQANFAAARALVLSLASQAGAATVGPSVTSTHSNGSSSSSSSSSSAQVSTRVLAIVANAASTAVTAAASIASNHSYSHRHGSYGNNGSDGAQSALYSSWGGGLTSDAAVHAGSGGAAAAVRAAAGHGQTGAGNLGVAAAERALTGAVAATGKARDAAASVSGNRSAQVGVHWPVRSGADLASILAHLDSKSKSQSSAENAETRATADNSLPGATGNHNGCQVTLPSTQATASALSGLSAVQGLSLRDVAFPTPTTNAFLHASSLDGVIDVLASLQPPAPQHSTLATAAYLPAPPLPTAAATATASYAARSVAGTAPAGPLPATGAALLPPPPALDLAALNAAIAYYASLATAATMPWLLPTLRTVLGVLNAHAAAAHAHEAAALWRTLGDLERAATAQAQLQEWEEVESEVEGLLTRLRGARDTNMTHFRQSLFATAANVSDQSAESDADKLTFGAVRTATLSQALDMWEASEFAPQSVGPLSRQTVPAATAASGSEQVASADDGSLGIFSLLVPGPDAHVCAAAAAASAAANADKKSALSKAQAKAAALLATIASFSASNNPAHMDGATVESSTSAPAATTTRMTATSSSGNSDTFFTLNSPFLPSTGSDKTASDGNSGEIVNLVLPDALAAHARARSRRLHALRSSYPGREASVRLLRAVAAAAGPLRAALAEALARHASSAAAAARALVSALGSRPLCDAAASALVRLVAADAVLKAIDPASLVYAVPQDSIANGHGSSSGAHAGRHWQGHGHGHRQGHSHGRGHGHGVADAGAVALDRLERRAESLSAAATRLAELATEPFPFSPPEGSSSAPPLPAAVAAAAAEAAAAAGGAFAAFIPDTRHGASVRAAFSHDAAGAAAAAGAGGARRAQEAVTALGLWALPAGWPAGTVPAGPASHVLTAALAAAVAAEDARARAALAGATAEALTARSAAGAATAAAAAAARGHAVGKAKATPARAVAISSSSDTESDIARGSGSGSDFGGTHVKMEGASAAAPSRKLPPMFGNDATPDDTSASDSDSDSAADSDSDSSDGAPVKSEGAVKSEAGAKRALPVVFGDSAAPNTSDSDDSSASASGSDDTSGDDKQKNGAATVKKPLVLFGADDFDPLASGSDSDSDASAAGVGDVSGSDSDWGMGKTVTRRSVMSRKGIIDSDTETDDEKNNESNNSHDKASAGNDATPQAAKSASSSSSNSSESESGSDSGSDASSSSSSSDSSGESDSDSDTDTDSDGDSRPVRQPAPRPLLPATAAADAEAQLLAIFSVLRASGDSSYLSDGAWAQREAAAQPPLTAGLWEVPALCLLDRLLVGRARAARSQVLLQMYAELMWSLYTKTHGGELEGDKALTLSHNNADSEHEHERAQNTRVFTLSVLAVWLEVLRRDPASFPALWHVAYLYHRCPPALAAPVAAETTDWDALTVSADGSCAADDTDVEEIDDVELDQVKTQQQRKPRGQSATEVRSAVAVKDEHKSKKRSVADLSTSSSNDDSESGTVSDSGSESEAKGVIVDSDTSGSSDNDFAVKKEDVVSSAAKRARLASVRSAPETNPSSKSKSADKLSVYSNNDSKVAAVNNYKRASIETNASRAAGVMTADDTTVGAHWGLEHLASLWAHSSECNMAQHIANLAHNHANAQASLAEGRPPGVDLWAPYRVPLALAATLHHHRGANRDCLTAEQRMTCVDGSYPFAPCNSADGAGRVKLSVEHVWQAAARSGWQPHAALCAPTLSHAQQSAAASTTAVVTSAVAGFRPAPALFSLIVAEATARHVETLTATDTAVSMPQAVASDFSCDDDILAVPGARPAPHSCSNPVKPGFGVDARGNTESAASLLSSRYRSSLDPVAAASDAAAAEVRADVAALEARTPQPPRSAQGAAVVAWRLLALALGRVSHYTQCARLFLELKNHEQSSEHGNVTNDSASSSAGATASAQSMNDSEAATTLVDTAAVAAEEWTRAALACLRPTETMRPTSDTTVDSSALVQWRPLCVNSGLTQQHLHQWSSRNVSDVKRVLAARLSLIRRVVRTATSMDEYHVGIRAAVNSFDQSMFILKGDNGDSNNDESTFVSHLMLLFGLDFSNTNDDASYVSATLNPLMLLVRSADHRARSRARHRVRTRARAAATLARAIAQTPPDAGRRPVGPYRGGVVGARAWDHIFASGATQPALLMNLHYLPASSTIVSAETVPAPLLTEAPRSVQRAVTRIRASAFPLRTFALPPYYPTGYLLPPVPGMPSEVSAQRLLPVVPRTAGPLPSPTLTWLWGRAFDARATHDAFVDTPQTLARLAAGAVAVGTAGLIRGARNGRRNGSLAALRAIRRCAGGDVYGDPLVGTGTAGSASAEPSVMGAAAASSEVAPTEAMLGSGAAAEYGLVEERLRRRGVRRAAAQWQELDKAGVMTEVKRSGLHALMRCMLWPATISHTNGTSDAAGLTNFGPRFLQAFSNDAPVASGQVSRPGFGANVYSGDASTNTSVHGTASMSNNAIALPIDLQRYILGAPTTLAPATVNTQSVAGRSGLPLWVPAPADALTVTTTTITTNTPVGSAATATVLQSCAVAPRPLCPVSALRAHSSSTVTRSAHSATADGNSRAFEGAVLMCAMELLTLLENSLPTAERASSAESSSSASYEAVTSSDSAQTNLDKEAVSALRAFILAQQEKLDSSAAPVARAAHLLPSSVRCSLRASLQLSAAVSAADALSTRPNRFPALATWTRALGAGTLPLPPAAAARAAAEAEARSKGPDAAVRGRGSGADWWGGVAATAAAAVENKSKGKRIAAPQSASTPSTASVSHESSSANSSASANAEAQCDSTGNMCQCWEHRWRSRLSWWSQSRAHLLGAMPLDSAAMPLDGTLLWAGLPVVDAETGTQWLNWRDINALSTLPSAYLLSNSNSIAFNEVPPVISHVQLPSSAALTSTTDADNASRRLCTVRSSTVAAVTGESTGVSLPTLRALPSALSAAALMSVYRSLVFTAFIDAAKASPNTLLSLSGHASDSSATPYHSDKWTLAKSKAREDVIAAAISAANRAAATGARAAAVARALTTTASAATENVRSANVNVSAKGSVSVGADTGVEKTRPAYHKWLAPRGVCPCCCPMRSRALLKPSHGVDALNAAAEVVSSAV